MNAPTRVEWRNWSGSVAFAPERVCTPADTAAVAAIVRDAHARGDGVRAVGAGHTSNAQLVSSGVLVSTGALCGIVAHDRAALTATVRAGTPLQDLGRDLYEHDLALPNFGDIASQTVGGAIATGTHGTGRDQPNLSRMLVGATLVDGRGYLRTIGRDETARLRAARVALGTLGIVVEATLSLVPTFDVERREYACGTDATLARLDEFVAGNRSFDFYWYPRRDDCKLRFVNAVDGGTPAPDGARLVEFVSGRGHEIIPTHTGIPHRFEECEYAVPLEAGPACFRAVRERILARWRATVGWRVLYRTVAADDSYLSPASGRDTATISLHQNASLPWCEYFADLEPVFRDHGGRPHWAKKHTMDAEALAPLYPAWNEFARIRRRFDPDGTFLTPYLHRLLEGAS